MGKFIKNDGTKIPVGTVLFDGATQSDFTLTDDISNYDYLTGLILKVLECH